MTHEAGSGPAPPASRVTSLTPSKRRRGWLVVQLDGASRLQLPRNEVEALGLEVGRPVSAERIRALSAEAERQEAWRVAIRYLSVRPRSRQEVERRLRRKAFSEAAVGAAIARGVELAYLDDRAFAAAYTRDRIRLRPRSVPRMIADLAARGVARADAVAGVTDAMREEDVTESDLLERAAAKGAARLGAGDPGAARRRFYAYLARRGFRAEEIRAWLEARFPSDGSREGTSEGERG